MKCLSRLRYTDFGFIFQQIHLVSNLTLFENVAVCGYLNKSRSAADVSPQCTKYGLPLKRPLYHALPSERSARPC